MKKLRMNGLCGCVLGAASCYIKLRLMQHFTLFKPNSTVKNEREK